MNKDIIRQYEDIKRELEDAKRRVEQAAKELEKYDSKYQVIDSTSGGMGGLEHFVIRGFPYPEYSRKKTRLLQRKMRMEDLQERLEMQLEEVEAFIDGINDSRKRLVMRYKYIDGLTWKQIAKKLGPGYTEDAIRMEITRFLDHNDT